MSKLVQAASIIALAAAASSAGAWYNAPVAPIMTPEMAEQQMQAISAQHAAMAAQQNKAVEQAMEAHRQMMEQRAADSARMPFGIDSGFPETAALPEFGQIPAMPEMPAMPELGQYPAMPEFPSVPDMQIAAINEFVKTRMEEMDAHRAKVQQGIQERRDAFKAMSEQRRAPHPHAMERAHMAGLAPAMMSHRDCAPKAQAPEQQAAAPAAAAQ
jgi:hypothetical protein